MNKPEPGNRKRLNVLFLTSWYPEKENPVGGIFVREHAKAVQHYDNVIVLHLKGTTQGLLGFWQMEKETGASLSEGIPTYRLCHKRSPVLHTTVLIDLYSALQAFRRLRLLEFSPDILHAHIHRAGFTAVLLGKLFNIPVVITEQNSAFPRRLLRKADIALARFAFSRAGAVLPVSIALQKGIQQYGIEANWNVIPNTVNTSLFHPLPFKKKECYSLLFVGGFSPIKGLPILFQALNQLHDRRDWRLDLVGGGTEEGAYRSQVEGMDLSDRVIFHGIQPKKEVAAFMQQADLFVLPSLWDNMPCVLVEAMASGLPVVSTETGGIPEIVSSETGFLAPPRDPDRLAEALTLALNQIHQFDRLRIAQIAQQYSYEEIGKRIDAVYRAVRGKSSYDQRA